MASAFKDPRFHDEEAAFAALERVLWPNGKPPHCPHCGVVDRANRLAVQTSKASKKHPDGKPVFGLWKCYACRKQFTVRKGTVFEESRLELHQWLQAAFLMCSSKKGISTNQLHRTLGCTLKTAWFVSMRLREAMAEGQLNPFGSGGGAVEIDETFIGQRKGAPVRHGYEHKHKVLSLVDRESGKARSMVVDNLKTKTVAPIVRANVAKEARLMTDEARHYVKVGREFAGHERVFHSAGEYGRGEVHTNTIEGFFSIFKRGMKGVYQHCSERHLHRYLSEFDFRYNHRIALGVNDHDRTVAALKGAVGKRLTYRDS
jgi:transposase-like protein